MREPATEEEIYQMQVRDKACTICANLDLDNVDAPESICTGCGDDRKFWINSRELRPSRGWTPKELRTLAEMIMER